MSSPNVSARNPSEARTQSGICVLWLLICKTAKFQLANTLTSVIIILGPIIVFFIYSATALLWRGNLDPERIYPPVNITTDVPYVYYSPKNRIVDEIIENVVRELGAKGSKGFFTASQLERGLIEDSAFVGIEFADEFKRIALLPAKVSVAVRFPMHLRTIPKMHWVGRVNYKRKHLGTDYYLVEGFLIIQAKLSEALIRARNKSAILPEVILKHFPEPTRPEGTFTESRVALAAYLFLPFAISSAYLAQVIVEDKQRWGHMRLMHVRGWVHWLSWFLVAFLFFFIPTLVLVLLLKWRLYPMSDFSLLLLFFSAYIVEVLVSALLLSALFSNTITVQVTILFLHLFSWLPWRLLVMGYQSTAIRSVFACLFLNSALAMGLEVFIEHESLFVGLHWDRVFKKTDMKDTVTLGVIMVTMLLASLGRILLLWYVEELWSKKHRRWYFPFQSRFWCSRRGKAVDVENQDMGEEQDHEPLSHRNHAIIVQVRHLLKTYNGNEVIRDVSLDCYKDEITVFLGHNDSGKTTLFRMLAGIEEPSSGSITINGFDMATQERKALSSMSMCPQKNEFYGNLKARWHIKFYCRLRGMNRKEASAEADKYLAIGHMEEFANMKVKNLSSGLKRMLALCCSLCGHSTVLLLDEPGTSMDPMMRREMWDLLRKERKGRCIIMSTHNMLEAEVVADRVVVMCDGQVIGYGTTGFLTQIADRGAAYFLICTKKVSCLVAEVTHFLQIRFPDIELDQEYGVYVTYRLPAKNVSKYSALFLQLEQNLDNLQLKEFRVRAPTLGDIFLHIGEEFRKTRDTIASMVERPHSSPMTSLINLLPTFELREDDQNVKCCNQWRAIMERKRIFMCRHRRIFLLIILMPVIIALLLVIFELLIYLLDRTPYVLKITDFSLVSPSTVVLESQENDTMGEQYRQNALGHGVKVTNTAGAPLGDYLMNLMLKDEMNYYSTIAAGATINKSIVAWSNKRLEHGTALALGLVYESLALAVAQLEIEVVNKPHPGMLGDITKGLTRINYMDFATAVLLYLVVGTAIFAVMPVMERQTSLQHQQLSSGMSRITYWLAHMLFDYCIYISMIPMLIIVATISAVSTWSITILLLSFGFAVISFTYLVCLVSNDLGKSFSIMMYVNMIGVLSLFIHPNGAEARYRIIEIVLMIHPHYALFNGVQDIVPMEKSLAHGSKAKIASTIAQHTEAIYAIMPIKYMIISGLVYLMLVLMSWIPRRIKYLFQAIKNEKILPEVDMQDSEVDKINQRLEFITTKNYKNFPLIMKNVSKRYGDLLAVRSLTLDINPFECVGLLGRNGAGKSSTFYMVVGKRSLTAGTLHIKGFSIKGRAKEGLKHLGFCPREDLLAPYMTGRETLYFFCLINGIRRSHVRMVVKSMAESFNLGPHMDKQVRTYSNGTKQKLIVAVAALAPTMLCLDEPTAGVDVYAKYEIWDSLESIRLGGRAILLTTHSMEECEMLCSNVGILDRGTLLCYGSLSHLRTRFDKGIFVKIKVGTLTELNIAKEETDRILKREESISYTRSTLASLKLSLRRSSQDYRPYGRMSDEGSTSSETDIREDYEYLLQQVEEVFLEDHPYSSVSEKYFYRGLITFSIPKESIKLSQIFRYMELIKKDLQIMHYTISHTTLEDVFMEFVRRHNK